MLEVTPVFVDWVTAVAPTGSHNSWLRRFLDGQDTKPVQKAYHRSHGLQYYPSGIRHYYSPHDSTVDSVIVMDGEALGNIRNEHDNEWCNKVVAILARNSSHFSRIDLSIDLMDNGLLAKTLAGDTLNDRMDWGRRNATVVMGQGEKGGCTVYVGARTSPKMLRVYDKFTESKGKVPSTRFEFELKAEAAQSVSETLSLFGGHMTPVKLFTGLLGDFADWTDYPEIEALQYGEVKSVNIPKRERLLGRKEWLRKQVLPTFAKSQAGEEAELWAWFKGLVESAHLSA